MPTRAQVSIWIAGCVLAAPAMAAAQDRTEREVIDLIVREGPRATAIRAESEVVRQAQQVRLAVPNPTVTYSREGAGFTEFLQVAQSLPVFGVRDAVSRAGAAAHAAATADAEVRLWALRTEAAVVVARLSAAQARLDAAQAHARDVERLIEILRARERDGEGSRFDRLRAEQELRDLRQIATAAAVDAGDARARVIGMLPAGAALARVLPRSGPRVAPIPASSDTLTARAVAIRGELRSLQRSAERAGLESTAARRTQFPVPTVFGGVKRAGFAGEGDRGGLIGVSLSLPLFDNGDREAARWSAERLRVDAERTSIEQEIRAEVAAAYAALSLRQTALADEPEGAGDELVRIADVAYREGEAGILELLDAVRIASRARVRGIELRLDERLSEIALERAVGEVLWP